MIWPASNRGEKRTVSRPEKPPPPLPPPKRSSSQSACAWPGIIAAPSAIPPNAINAALNILRNIWVTSMDSLPLRAPIAQEALPAPSPQDNHGRADMDALVKIHHVGVQH